MGERDQEGAIGVEPDDDGDSAREAGGDTKRDAARDSRRDALRDPRRDAVRDTVRDEHQDAEASYQRGVGATDAPFEPGVFNPERARTYAVIFNGLRQITDVQQRATSTLAAANVLAPALFPADKRPMHPSDVVASVLETLAATLRADKIGANIFPTLVGTEGGLANALAYAAGNSTIPVNDKQRQSDGLVADI